VGSHRLVSRCARDVVGNPFFSRAVALSNTIDDSMKGCHVQKLLTGSVRLVYVDWRRKRMCRVYQVFPVGSTSI
jgi:hypothetical protein